MDSASDWLVTVGRVIVLISAIIGARRAYLRSRIEGRAVTMATFVTTLLLLAYIVGGVLLFTWYGVFAYPRLWGLFLIGATLYVVGGITAVAKIGAYLDRVSRKG
jgi:hypothetical protein